jgi:hypothetical protein
MGRPGPEWGSRHILNLSYDSLIEKIFIDFSRFTPTKLAYWLICLLLVNFSLFLIGLQGFES